MRSVLIACGCWFVVFPCLGDELEKERLRNWHQWRGPLADGIAPHGDPPVKWGVEEIVKWKVEIPGEGHATPIVWGDRVFVLAAVETDQRIDELAPPKMEPPGGYKTARPTSF